jgi:hypothetical protein
MDLRKFLLGRGEFKSPSEVIQTVRESPDFDPQNENLTSAEALLIFQTPKQQTRLVAKGARLYCALDDLRRSFRPVRWSLAAKELMRDGNFAITISARDSNERTGLLNIGDRRNWLFTKKLFKSRSIEDEVKDLMRRQIVPATGPE